MIYLASPYSENPEVNYKLVLEFVIKHFRETGVMLFSPIIYGHNIATANKPLLEIDFSAWEVFDLDVLSRSDELRILKSDGWDRSEGIYQETEFALKNNIKIKYISWKQIKT